MLHDGHPVTGSRNREEIATLSSSSRLADYTFQHAQQPIHFQVNHSLLQFEGLQLLCKTSQSINMDSDVQRLVILLVFQLSLLCTMENLERDTCVISLWHW